mgnify:CR=1 FL=1
MRGVMERQELIAELFPAGIDPLWCPLLTHYIVRHGRVAVDRRRIAAQPLQQQRLARLGQQMPAIIRS